MILLVAVPNGGSCVETQKKANLKLKRFFGDNIRNPELCLHFPCPLIDTVQLRASIGVSEEHVETQNISLERFNNCH